MRLSRYSLGRSGRSTHREAIRACGGIGVTWERDGQLRLRHIHQLAHLPGDAEVSFEHLASNAVNDFARSQFEEVGRGPV
jgi:hypothetical protein